jgi:hypothetical protein
MMQFAAMLHRRIDAVRSDVEFLLAAMYGHAGQERLAAMLKSSLMQFALMGTVSVKTATKHHTSVRELQQNIASVYENRKKPYGPFPCAAASNPTIPLCGHIKLHQTIPSIRSCAASNVLIPLCGCLKP